jgi:type IV pilus assembly protein PilQ
LGKARDGDVIRIAPLSKLRAEEEEKEAELAALLRRQREQQMITAFIPVSYGDAQVIADSHLSPLLTPGNTRSDEKSGSVNIAERINTIVITDVPDVVKRAKEIVQKIDTVTPQVLIEARVVEASTSFSRELGTQLSIEAGPIVTSEVGNGVIPEGTTSVDASATNPIDKPLGQLGVNFTKLTGSPLSITAVLSAAESEGEIKIISAPRVLTLNNKTARIRQGTQVPIPRLDDSGNTIIEYKDVDLELEVTPHVTPDKRITMTIKVTNNEIGTLINSIQSFTTKEANTELLIENGETIVIGGIRKARRDQGETGVPGFKDIPVISWLFKKQTRSEDMEELLIFITPQIVQLDQKMKTAKGS